MRPVHAYLLATTCLLIGLPVGYFFRGSAPAGTPAAGRPVQTLMRQAAAGPSPEMPHSTAPTLEDMKRMANKKAEPLLARLRSDPKSPRLLNQIGIVYRSAHQFKEAEQYFEKSLQADPKNADVRTDMAACMYYTGDVDGALDQLDKALTYEPRHSGALMNIGIIMYRAKNDPAGAIAAWEKLLKLNPNFPQREAVQKMITEAKQNPHPFG